MGTPIAVTGANKALVQTSEYEPYGQLLNRTLTDGPGFTGHVQDAATGLTYMQQRYYDQGIGRFLSTDPVTAYAKPSVNFNRYWYANNNRYKFTDPDGRVAMDWVHGGLTAGSFCPSVCGSAFSAIDGVVSLAQGDRVGAGISFGAAAIGLVSDAGAAKAIAMGAREAAGASKLEGAAKLIHYTDVAAAKAIQETGKLLPNANGQVFLTAEKLSKSEVPNVLFLGNAGTKGSHVVEVELKAGAPIKQGRNANELIHEGTIRNGRQADITVKENDF